ncbi:hypothetical protein E2C01_075073 [Portunus trituberculatus]|uniref:Uncharacterized protein n=1 Tax=Portunus trituberculatus TaxID=210409 RepID=A0A5B7IE01_PORTR|nr:hypothetical protein [Portunus trituberculatus]
MAERDSHTVLIGIERGLMSPGSCVVRCPGARGPPSLNLNRQV